ncbi:hypothetical protein ACE6H2_007960 [Prunus campanulata]
MFGFQTTTEENESSQMRKRHSPPPPVNKLCYSVSKTQSEYSRGSCWFFHM